MTLVQRFGSALNLNTHFHMLVLDGAYLVGTHPPVFRRIEAPSVPELQSLLERLADRIGRALERKGILVRDAESSYLELGAETGRGMDELLGHSITYRVAVGRRAGQKMLALQIDGDELRAAACPIRGSLPRDAHIVRPQGLTRPLATTAGGGCASSI